MDNDNYNDSYYEEFVPRKHGPIFRAFKIAALVLTALFCIFLFARMRINKHVPASAESFLWDADALLAASYGSLEVTDHDIESYSGADGKRIIRNRMTADGHFSFSRVQYTDAGLQLTFRYNISALEEYSGQDEPFTYELVTEDGRVFDDYAYIPSEKSFLGRAMYEYRRIIFDGNCTDGTSTLTLRVLHDGQRVAELVVYDEGYETAFPPQSYTLPSPGGQSYGLIYHDGGDGV